MKKQSDEFPNPSDTDELQDDLPSKSQRKREALQAIDLAKALFLLPQGKRDRYKLSAQITDALKLADSIRSHGAKKRQLQYIGKLLRSSDDYDAYWQRFENPQNSTEVTATSGDTRHLKLSEDLHMCDRLLEDLAATMDDLRRQYPNANTQLIRQLVNRIHKSAKPATDGSDEAQCKLKQTLATALAEGRIG